MNTKKILKGLALAFISSLAIAVVLGLVVRPTEHPEKYGFTMGWISGCTFWAVYMEYLLQGTFRFIVSEHSKSKNVKPVDNSIPAENSVKYCQNCHTTESSSWRGERQKNGSWVWWCEKCRSAVNHHTS